jgi:hypothetical protein
MGIDWEVCHYCGDTFPDCGDHESCECGNHWCSFECAENEGFVRDEEAEEKDLESSCNFCRGEDYTDSELLSFLLDEIVKISREDVCIMKYGELKK